MLLLEQLFNAATLTLGVEGVVVLLLEQLFDGTTLALGVEGTTMLFP